jgi:hypothetical protein
MPNRDAGPVYLVQRVPWRATAKLLGHYDLDFEESRLDPKGFATPQDHDPGEGEPVKAFRDAARADALCRELERKARAAANPFRHGRDLTDVTGLPPGPLRDWLLDAGIDPPPKSVKALARWAAWWDKVAGGLSESQRAKVWEACDKVRFYEVVELGPAG